jgi:hypothetical protein
VDHALRPRAGTAVTRRAEHPAGIGGRPVTGSTAPRRRTATHPSTPPDIWNPRRRPVSPPCRTVTADLLITAADLLPAVVGRPPVLACDLHTALLEAAADVMYGGDRYAHLRTASHALDHFLSYLIATGTVAPAPRVSQLLRSWIRGRDLVGVQHALFAGADHCRSRGTIR